jgi:hypothetical protein
MELRWLESLKLAEWAFKILENNQNHSFFQFGPNHSNYMNQV